MKDTSSSIAPASPCESTYPAGGQPHQRRLSRRVTTGLLGAGGLSAMFVLSACESSIQAHSYRTTQECIAAQVYPEWECRERFDQAQKLHQNAAPQYARLEDCERDYGVAACEPEKSGTTSNPTTTHRSSFFSPLFYGYMMGHQPSLTTPLYRSSRAELVTASGVSVSRSTLSPGGGQVYQDSFQRPLKRPHFAQGQTVSQRGGFGASARGRSGG